MVLSYRTAIAPLLPSLAEKLALGFSTSRQGCYLWATDSIVREFTSDSPQIGKDTIEAVFAFFQQQATTFLRALNDLPPEELPDGEIMCRHSQLDMLTFHSNRGLLPPLH